jgi:hypothetical protein
VNTAPTPASRSRGRVICFGIYFWYPLAGVTYQMLHYLLGLRALGFDVWYVEDTWRDVYDPWANDYVADYSNVVKHLGPVLDRFGFQGRWCARDKEGQCFGMTEAQLFDLYKNVDASLNLCGGHEVRDEHMAIPARVYVESDPFALQVRCVKGQDGTREFLDQHTHLFTFGENIGQPDCLIPATGHTWMPTRQPVHMDLWRTTRPGGDTYNTITTWHNNGDPVEWQGDHYWWTKDREFVKFIDLPLRRPGAKFELASGVQADVRDMLLRNGWKNIDSMDLSLSAEAYRDYIHGSRGEFTVARDQYTRPKTGWFSDRSVAYLASGRPVITGETGFSKTVPSGRGLFGFQTMDDVLAAVDAIESDYAGHCRAAGEIADAYFCSKKVLASLMTRAGLL